MERIKLTKFAHGAGCGCKIAPQVLEEILQDAKTGSTFPSLLIGNQSNDDAAVYRLNEEEALIATNDFFTPIVDDPRVFGKVAAANALSDVYAMGGQPLMALSILGWPLEKLSTASAREVIAGAMEICEQAGIPLAGGHSIDSTEPFFGLAVNGRVKINHIKSNSNAQAGDVIILTKPIGVGILTTAAKREILDENDLHRLIPLLTQLNKVGTELGKIDAIHAMTDVTGFGLAGHLIEMAEGADLSVQLNFSAIPKIPTVEQYLSKNTIPDATYRNWNAYGSKVHMNSTINTLQAFQLLPDPQTNGGLLIALAPNAVSEIMQILTQSGFQHAAVIGQFIPQTDQVLYVS